MHIPKSGKYPKEIREEKQSVPLALLKSIWESRIPRGFSANLVLAGWFVFGGFLQHILLCNFLAILLKENNLTLVVIYTLTSPSPESLVYTPALNPKKSKPRALNFGLS